MNIKQLVGTVCEGVEGWWELLSSDDFSERVLAILIVCVAVIVAVCIISILVPVVFLVGYILSLPMYMFALGYLVLLCIKKLLKPIKTIGLKIKTWTSEE